MGENEKASLEHFKDWSNYLLLAAIAAVGWTGAQASLLESNWRVAALVALGVSVTFGIFTLSLVPLVAESISVGKSIYAVEVRPWVLFDRQRLRWFQLSLRLKDVCLVQHAAFIAGVILFIVGAAYGHG